MSGPYSNIPYKDDIKKIYLNNRININQSLIIITFNYKINKITQENNSFSYSFNWLINPLLGKAVLLILFKYSNASSNFILMYFIKYAIINETDLDLPIWQ